MGTAHHKRQRPLRRDDEERGLSKFRRMPLRAGSGRARGPQSPQATVGQKGRGRRTRSNGCEFVLLILSRPDKAAPAGGGDAETRGRNKEEN